MAIGFVNVSDCIAENARKYWSFAFLTIQSEYRRIVWLIAKTTTKLQEQCRVAQQCVANGHKYAK